jgi:malonyl-CoA O-methyltransferase
MTAAAIIRNFDAAAARYDAAATAQAMIAERLVVWAAESLPPPRLMLDAGCGTGLVAKALHRRWPEAAITAMDSSAAMLKEARQKLPFVSTLQGDLRTNLKMADPGQKFDAIFSSMVLHWLGDPPQRLRTWRGWLKPQGKLFVALPVEGSFHQWRDLCRQYNVADGTLILPPADFAGDAAARVTCEDFDVAYATARDFLRAMKATGASTPRQGHRPVSAPRLRKLLNASPRPMPVTYRIAFLELAAISDP